MNLVKTQVYQDLINNGIEIENSNLTIAFSGGADSTALLHIFLELKNELNINLSACYLNHLIRKESTIEQAKLEKKCNIINIPFFTESINIPKIIQKSKNSLETEARIQRYAFFKRAKSKFNSKFVLTGHHKDDVIETFLYRLFTGTGIEGIKSITYQRDFYLRPLLNISKKNLYCYLKRNKINYFEDYTNKSNDIKRNYIRNVIIPSISKEFESFDKKILNFIDISKTYSLFMKKNIVKNYPFFNNNNWDIKNFESINENIVKTLLYYKILTNKKKFYINYKIINDIYKKIFNSKDSSKLYCSNELNIYKYNKKIYFSDNIIKRTTSKINLSIGEFKFSYYTIKVNYIKKHCIENLDDFFYIDMNLLEYLNITARLKDDYIHKLNTSKKLNKEFKDKKIPFFERDFIPILRYKGKCIGYFYNNKYFLDKSFYLNKNTDKTIIKIQIRKDIE